MRKELNKTDISDDQSIVTEILKRNEALLQRAKKYRSGLIGLTGSGVILILGSQMIMHGVLGAFEKMWNQDGFTALIFVANFISIWYMGKRVKELERVDYSVSTIELLRDTLLKHDHSIRGYIKQYGWGMNVLALFTAVFLGFIINRILIDMFAIDSRVFTVVYVLSIVAYLVIAMQVMKHQSKAIKTRIHNVILEMES
ncbi:MAG: hypothetical protein OCD76_10555 [Reichenbachiella sp.]